MKVAQPSLPASGHSPGMQRDTRAWQAADVAHHLHPFSDMASLRETGTRVITRAEGVWLWDSEGNRIIDGMAGLWCVNLGYGRRELIEAATRQLAELPFYNTFFRTTHPPVIALSEQLAEVMPEGFQHFFYCNSGSEGNDTVMRIVHRYWAAHGQPARRWFISRRNGYHGSTLAAASLGGMGYMHEQMPARVPFIHHIDQPYWYAEGGALTPAEFGLRCAQQLETAIIDLGAENVAAFIGEPFQGAGGVIFPPESYWQAIERICRKYDILLCADEVIGGFGRTGQWFAHQHFGFSPDLITMAKGLTSGYIPMGAVGVHQRVAETLIDGGEFNHGMTYSGHPVAAAVALASLRVLREQEIIPRVHGEIGPYFQRSLRTALEGSAIVGEIQGVGLVAGIQLCDERATRRRFVDGDAVGLACRNHAFAHNLIMRATHDRMLLSPPLVILRSEIDQLVERVAHCVQLTAQERGLV